MPGLARLIPRSVVTAVLCLVPVGCGDPSRPLEPVPADGSMMIFLVLAPDRTVQPMLLESIEPDRGWKDLRVDLYLDGMHAASEAVPSEPDPDDLHPCILLYGSPSGFDPRCSSLNVGPPYGAHYRLVVSAAGRPTASAEGTIPADFEIVSVSARGDPPGTEGLEVHWTRSNGTWRYAVGIRPDSIRGCGRSWHTPECKGDWFAATADTVLRTTVPRDAVEGGVGPWSIDVYAMEQGLYEHLTTGAAGAYFSVPPVQNVEGGYGAVGAWVWRTAELQP